MSKVTFLPERGTLRLPVGRRGSVRLTPVANAPMVLLELRGPYGGDLGGLVVDVGSAQLLAEGLIRMADRDPTVGSGTASVQEDPAPPRRSPGLSLDPDGTLENFGRLAVPMFADWCSIDVVCLRAGQRRLPIVHADTSKRKVAKVIARYPHDPRTPHPRSEVWTTGRAHVTPDIPDELLIATAHGAEHLAALRAIGFRSCIPVPLRTGAGVFGVMTFAFAESRRRYTEAELPVALTLGRCAALAAENARLYREAQDALRPGIGVAPVRQGRGPMRQRGSRGSG
jgi:hypothetical protein